MIGQIRSVKETLFPIDTCPLTLSVCEFLDQLGLQSAVHHSSNSAVTSAQTVRSWRDQAGCCWAPAPPVWLSLLYVQFLWIGLETLLPCRELLSPPQWIKPQLNLKDSFSSTQVWIWNLWDFLRIISRLIIAHHRHDKTNMSLHLPDSSHPFVCFTNNNLP